MGLISELLGTLRGKKATPRTVADVEAALARLAVERTAAREAVTAAMREREALLLEDESDARIADLDATADRSRLTLERVEKLEPMILEELQGAREAAKREQWRRLFAEKYVPAVVTFAEAHRAALEALEALNVIRGEAQSAGFGSEAAHAMPPVGNILTREILHYIEREADRAHDAANAKPRKPAPIAQPKAAPAPTSPKPPSRRMVEMTAPASNDLAVLQRKRDRDLLRIEGEIPPGHKALRLLRSDIEIKPGLMGWKGDEVALPEYQAHRMVENSAAEFIEPAPVESGEAA